jgi:hypothetical protein
MRHHDQIAGVELHGRPVGLIRPEQLASPARDQVNAAATGFVEQLPGGGHFEADVACTPKLKLAQDFTECIGHLDDLERETEDG